MPREEQAVSFRAGKMKQRAYTHTHTLKHAHAHLDGGARFKQKVTGADVNDEIRSLFKAPSGFTGQLVRKRPPPFS